MRLELGARVIVRDAVTLDELADLHAPAPVEPGDLVATVDELYAIEVVLAVPAGATVVPVPARRLELMSG